MNIRSLFLFSLLSVGFSYTSVWSADGVRVFDCVRFAENGNDIIVDTECLLRGLRNGADPNWVSRANKRHTSTLSNFVRITSLSDDPKTVSAGTDAVKILIGAGAKLQSVDTDILFWPISHGKVSLVSILLELGASASAWPNDEIGTALTPAETAAANGHDLIVDLLVKHGAAKPSSKTALQERFIKAASFGSIEDLAVLVSQGANVNGKGRNNEVALINAIWSSTHNCTAYAKIRWLLEKGADANLEGTGVFLLETAPPLHQAVWVTGIRYKAKQETVCAELILRELIKRGAHVSARDSMGRTPLHIAAERNHVAAAQLLLESGSKIMPRDKKGRTPLDMAESSEMIKLLKRHAAAER
jgi:ankyrin repeat protein